MGRGLNKDYGSAVGWRTSESKLAGTGTKNAREAEMSSKNIVDQHYRTPFKNRVTWKVYSTFNPIHHRLIHSHSHSLCFE